MYNALVWTGAIGGIIAAIAGIIAAVGAWRTESTARWQTRAERLRTDKARHENELHRQRFTSVWNYQRDQPDGPERTEAARWYSEWAGAAWPRRGGLDDGPQSPGLHSPDANDAYERYVDFLSAEYEPGRLGPPSQPLQAEPPN
jgi:hypothetical protein